MIWARWPQTFLLLTLALARSGVSFGVSRGAADLSVVPVQIALNSPAPGFTLMALRETGVLFTNVLQGDAFLTNAVAHNGSGLALGDVDGDGWVDIYLCSLQGPNRLYRNRGDWHFEEVPLGPEACADQYSTGAVLADVDGDGDLDLLVNGIAAGTHLFFNDGKGHFTEAINSGLSKTASSTSMALADIDGDGDLDLYCTHYIDVMHLADPTTRFAMMQREGKMVVTKVNDEPATLPKWKDRFEVLPGGRIRELPEVHGLYRNDGHGHFTAIQFEPGVFRNERGEPIPPYRDWGLSVMFHDLNGDGVPDLYVCNDNASPDRVWINSGKGTFQAVPAYTFRHSSRSSMGLDIADVNRDGRPDIFVLDMLARDRSKRMTQQVRDHSDPAEFQQPAALPRYNRNTLFLQRKDGSYTEVALMAGIAATDWSWCPIFLDVDLDGYEDLLISNGFSFDVMDQDAFDQLRQGKRLTRDQLQKSRQFYPPWPTKNAAFKNLGNGMFVPADHEWGFDHAGVANGMAAADLDNDGDLDIVINNLNAAPTILRNNATAPRIAVRLRGIAPNTEGIGARIQLIGEGLTQSQEMIAGGRYMSSDQPLRVFAADPERVKPTRIEVTWRTGKRSTISDVRPNCIYTIQESGAVNFRPPQAPKAEPFFEDVSSRLAHVHRDEPFDDWARQPLLPHRLSRLGPGIAWADLNGDGWEDLVVPGGRGGKLAFLISNRGESFSLIESGAALSADQGAVVSFPEAPGKSDAERILGTFSNYGLPPGRESALFSLSFTNTTSSAALPAGKASVGPLALADIDNDGDLDLFAGGGFIPGRYPEPVSSSIWLNDHGQFRLNEELSEPFKNLGTVNGATFADLDGDGRPDLALALEWGPVCVFRNVSGHFENVTDAWGFSNSSGLWMSIVAGDFDGDGKLDLAAGNWGRNSEYNLPGGNLLRVYYGEWQNRGIVDILEARERQGEWWPIRDRRALVPAVPDLAARFPTCKAFGQATVSAVLGSRFAAAQFRDAAQLDSAVFLNRGNHFERIPLPLEAQITPVFGLNVSDFDGDGIEDLFLGQNFYGTASDLTREDGGFGLWLRGLGDGTFSPVDSIDSGIRIEGEQRGSAVADFNHDGRVDLAVAQNNGPTRLLLNRRGRPGLRVSLRGPASNPRAVGARVRVVLDEVHRGPVRAVQAGSGYRSQDGAVQILGLPSVPRAVWIRWPDGKEQTLPVKPGQREVTAP